MGNIYYTQSSMAIFFVFRPMPSLTKTYFDYIMNLRALMLANAGLADAPLTTDLPPTWTRADTQCIHDIFLKAEFPAPATKSVSFIQPMFMFGKANCNPYMDI